MEQEKKEKRVRIGALDVFIIIAVLACVVGLGLRMFMKGDTVVNNNAVMEDYVISFSVSNIRASSVKYFNKGDVFFIKENSMRFGELTETSDLLARRYYTNMDGQVVYVMNESTDDRTKRVDLEAEIAVMGFLDANGRFLLNGNQYLGVNKEIEIKSKYITVNVKITSIAKS